MQRVDIVIALLAVVALGGSIVGVILYEAPEEPLWDVSYATESSGSTQAARFTSAGETTWTLERPNVTAAEFVATVQGSASPLRLEATTVTITITAPNGATHEEEVTLPQGQPGGALTTDTMSFTLSSLPEAMQRVEAANRTAALPAANLTGTGDWMIEASWSTGDVQQEGITVTVAVTYTYYVGRVAQHTPDIGSAA